MTAAALKGYRLGWDDAARYTRGSKLDRRAIRRRLAKSVLSGAAFWAEYRAAFGSRTEAFAAAIHSGRLPRTCNPHKLMHLADRDWSRPAA
jgi:hypothetical protein